MLAKLCIKFLLLVPLLAEANSTCDEILGQEVQTSPRPNNNNYFYRRLPPVTTTITKNATIICSNITSLSEIDYISEGKVYEQFLKIVNSEIPTLPALALSNFTSISKLFLGGNGIKSVLPRAFSGLVALKELHLNDNELTEVSNGVYNALRQLEVLNLTNNKIWKIEVFSLMGVGSLVRLHLGSNNISEVEDGVFENLKDLKYLDVSENPLQNISFDGLTKLDKLILRNTSLKDWKKKLSNLTVTILDLSHSQFGVVDFGTFPKTELVDLSDNEITSLENCQLLNSKTVILDTNKIQKINGTFAGLSKLYMSHNSLENLTHFSLNNSQSVEVIDFSFNKISTIVKNFFNGLYNLKLLLLQNNRFSKIDPGLFQNLRLLHFLNLSYNVIDEFKYGTFDNLVNLEVMDISGNRLVDLNQDTFHPLSKLRKLYFDNNRISTLNVTDLKRHLPKLVSISLDKNPWRCQDLVKIKKLLNILPGGEFDTENVHGIACSTRVDQNSTEEESKILEKLDRFFNEDFNNSSFAKMLKNFRPPVEYRQNLDEGSVERLVSVEETSSDFVKTVFVFGVVIQFVIASLLLFAVCLIFKFLKKSKVQKRPRSYTSDLELY